MRTILELVCLEQVGGSCRGTGTSAAGRTDGLVACQTELVTRAHSSVWIACFIFSPHTSPTPALPRLDLSSRAACLSHELVPGAKLAASRLVRCAATSCWAVQTLASLGASVPAVLAAIQEQNDQVSLALPAAGRRLRCEPVVYRLLCAGPQAQESVRAQPELRHGRRRAAPGPSCTGPPVRAMTRLHHTTRAG
jgi:hypothetical protein